MSLLSRVRRVSSALSEDPRVSGGVLNVCGWLGVFCTGS